MQNKMLCKEEEKNSIHMSNKWLWCLEILRVKHKLRYTSQLIWQTHIPLTHSLTRTHTRTIEHSATSIPSPSRFYPLPPFPKQQVYQDTIKNYHSTQKCKHMKCRSMYLSWLNSVAISLKLERAWLSVKSMKRRKKSLYQMSYQEIRHAQHFCQVLCVFVCEVIL